MSLGPHIVILAAGLGKRMHSRMPKVLHPVLFRPMLHYVLDLAKAIPNESVHVVVGHGSGEVKKACEAYPEVNFVHQDRQLGTAHAVSMLEAFLKTQNGQALILSGDVILLRPSTIKSMLSHHANEKAHCTLLTTFLDDPKGYGRVLRGSGQTITDIREEADCSDKEREIREINCGIYCFEIPSLVSALSKVTNTNAQKEYYLPDTVRFLLGKKIASFAVADSNEIMGINDRYALWTAEKILQERINRILMHRGVTLKDPQTTFIDTTSKIDSDVTIEGGCNIINSTIHSGVIIESGCRISKSIVESESHVKQGSYIENSEIGNQCTVGPYAHLRPHSVLKKGVKIGNFVELKKSVMGEGSKASHLAYVGDAEVGNNVNLGCGFITCNYDGRPEKHKTIIEDDVFIGSDSQTVAPVRVGKGSYVASGTTLTEDVPPYSLALSRGRQVTKEGYAKKYKK